MFLKFFLVHAYFDLTVKSVNLFYRVESEYGPSIIKMFINLKF